MFDQLATKIKRKEASLIYRLKTTYDMVNAIGEKEDVLIDHEITISGNDSIVNYINEGGYYFRD